MGKKEKFNFQDFKEEFGDVVFDIVNNVPKKWKAAAADFVASQAVIAGARNTYEGIGILEAVKADYKDLCERVWQQEMCDKCEDKVCLTLKGDIETPPKSGSQV